MPLTDPSSIPCAALLQVAFLRAAQHGVERLVKGEGLSRDQAIDALLGRLQQQQQQGAAREEEPPVVVDAVEVSPVSRCLLSRDRAIRTTTALSKPPRRPIQFNQSQLVALMSAYPDLSKEEAARALRVKAAVGALRRRGWDVGSALGELTAR